MQFTSGLRSILSDQRVYSLFRRLTGSEKLHRILLAEYIRPEPGDVVLDVGCGPADILGRMPAVEYYGIDLSAHYIAAAERRYAGRGKFLCGSIDDLERAKFPAADICLALGLLHHLDDGRVVQLLAAVRRTLKPGGRFISYDPCFTVPQHPLARAVHRLDRGGNVRGDRAMTQLVQRVFPQAEPVVRCDLCSIPSSVIIFPLVV